MADGAPTGGRRIDHERAVLVPATRSGEPTFAISEYARKARIARLVWRDFVVNHARLHTALEVWALIRASLRRASA